MYSSVDSRISEAARYVESFHWWLTVVRGTGEKPKAPMYDGWPDFRPSLRHLESLLAANPLRGLGINLGGSGLLDLEADSDQGDAQLDDLCRGHDFPCWHSRRGKHRLFLAPDGFGHLNITSLGIEFRAGRHQSILPPSVIGDERVEYRWIVSPFDCPPPPLPPHLIEFAEDHRKNPANRSDSPYRRGSKRAAWPYRDHLDYVFRYHDLRREAEKVGVELLFDTADDNGNIPCFVPAVLRDGRHDHHPSGVFNIFNGVLRDFATGRNHLFFHMLAALTGRPWAEILKEFEKTAGPTSGRPHSRRLTIPNPGQDVTNRITLADARAELGRYYEEQLSRPPRPKTINIVKCPPGVGKTYGLCKSLAKHGKRAIILTQENRLAGRHRDLIDEDGIGNAGRMPVLRDTACPYPDEYEATVRRGFKPTQSLPCRTCPIGPRHCPYLVQIPDLKDATQLCAALIFHTHDGFYESYGNEKRGILVYDENCVDFLLESKSNNLTDWQAWGMMLRQWQAEKPKDAALVDPFLKLIDWLNQTVEVFQKQAAEDKAPVKFAPFTLPDEIKQAEIKKIPRLVNWLTSLAFTAEHRHVTNLYDAARYLLTAPDTYVLLERFGNSPSSPVKVRFRKRNPLPEDKEVFILDATANEDLIRALAPGWDVQVWTCPPIEQEGRILQIMDYDLSRNRIESEVSRHTDHNPSWLVQTLDHILDAHGPAAVISFKDVTKDTPNPKRDILAKLKHQDRILSRHNFPCRGHDFVEDKLIVVGTPYKDQAAIWELALALWGVAGLPASNYEHREREHGCFVAKNMGYEEDRLKLVQEFLLSAELVQAIGRVRPLQNPSLVFVISNAPIPDWQVEQFMAAELFDMRQQIRRSDVAQHFEGFCGEVKLLLATGNWVKLMDMTGKYGSARTKRRYWQRLIAGIGQRIEVDGRKIRLRIGG